MPLFCFVLYSTAQAASSASEQLNEISYPPVYRAEGSAEIFQILLYTLGAGGSMLYTPVAWPRLITVLLPTDTSSLYYNTVATKGHSPRT